MIQVYSLHYDIRFLSYFTPLVMALLAKLMQGRAKDSNKGFINFAIVELLIAQTFIVVVSLLEYQNVYQPYKNKDFLTVEGEISAYETDSAVEKFEINGVEFEYSDRDMMLGYNQIKENGGVIHGNGEKVRIDYIRYNGRNIIVSIYEKDVVD